MKLNSYGGDIRLPVDYTANWKKVNREVGRVRGREGVREDRPITWGGRDEVQGRENGMEGRGTERGREGETRG